MEKREGESRERRALGHGECMFGGRCMCACLGGLCMCSVCLQLSGVYAFLCLVVGRGFLPLLLWLSSELIVLC